MFRTRVTEMLGIKHPIILGAMAGLGRAELVAAVSNAGGLGILPAFNFRPVEKFREELKKVKGLTDKPFAVNITLFPGLLQPNFEEFVYAAVNEGVRIFETAGRNPEPYLKPLKEAKVITMHKVARARDARTTEKLGINIVTVVGYEEAGHHGREDVTTIVRVPMVVDSVKIPVIAAGGIGDARGFIAALALGAEGVQMGTRFMASQECRLSPNAKERLLEAQENETINIDLDTDPSRVVLMKKDDPDSGYSCGQVVGLIHDIPTVKEIIDRMISEATVIAQRLNLVINPLNKD